MKNTFKRDDVVGAKEGVSVDVSSNVVDADEENIPSPEYVTELSNGEKS